MRIAVYGPGIGSERGGAATLEQDIFKAFLANCSASNHQFLIYTKNAKEFGKRYPSSNVRYIELPEKKWRTLRIFELVNRLQDAVFEARPFALRGWFEKSLESEGAQLVYYTTNRFEPCNQPYIYTILDIENFTQAGFPEITQDGEGRRRGDFYKSVGPSAVYVIAANEAGKQQIANYLHIEADRILGLPYFSPSFSLEGRQKAKDPKILKKYSLSAPFIYYPAKCYPHKNHVAILHSLFRLREQHSMEVHAVFTGPDGGNRSHVERLAKQLGIEKSVHFLGLVPIEDVIQLYKHAVALTYMSYFGPSNIPALEAMALGCPVINSSAVGAQEELGEAAQLVDPSDDEGLASAIAKLMKDKNLSESFRQKGFERVARWTAQDYVRAVFSLFDRYEKVRRTWGVWSSKML